jgi:hypothetical protein
MAPRALRVDRGKVARVEQGVPRPERGGRLVILRAGQLELLDLPPAAEIVFVLVDLPQPRAVLAVRRVSLVPMRFRRMRGEPTIRTGKVDLFHRPPRGAVRLGIGQAGFLGGGDRVVEADGTGREGLDRRGFFPERGDRGGFERVEEVVGAV